HEFGVRMAFGAQAGDIAALVLRRSLLLVSVGLGLGLVGALAALRGMTALLAGVTGLTSLALLAASGLLALVALLACWIPARRATRVDPMTALRYE
ncbi:MAG: FtsX-like permease family protein, partial [Candidatus Acidiferrales bacterium]